MNVETSSTPDVVSREPASSRPEDGHLLFAVAVGLLVTAYNFFLVERERSVLAKGPTFLGHLHLSWLEMALYASLFCCYSIVLLTGLTALLSMAGRSLRKHSVLGKLPGLLVATTFAIAVTAEFKVFQFFRGAFDLTLMRNLGGGSLWNAWAYAKDEFNGLLPPILASLGVLILGAILVGRRVRTLSALPRIARRHARLWRPRRLLVYNAVLLFAPVLIVAASPALNEALGNSLAYRIYKIPAQRLTDFDGDGYGMMDRPADFAPFDPRRHPYAVDIPGNGIDEDGIGGDLPSYHWNRVIPRWTNALQRRNVLLIVLETARADLLTADVNGVPVMPTLRNLPGYPIQIVSHNGFTAAAVTSILNGTVALDETDGISLIDRFHELGYATGVFSGQHEGHGNIASRTNMLHADRFEDATTFPARDRMYGATLTGSLAFPSPLVTAAFTRWLTSLDPYKPFFAYLNWQEMHFPYYYPGAPKRLLLQPIPRADISPDRAAWTRDTYWNAARLVDESLASVMAALDKLHRREDTVVLVTGDHGEELFEQGFLGHGVNLDVEEYRAVAKLINSPWKPPAGPVGQSDVGAIIHNALSTPRDALPLYPDVLCFVGDPSRPTQIGLMTARGLIAYDFLHDAWTGQSLDGGPMFQTKPSLDVIQTWESFVGLQLASRTQETKR